MMRQLIKIGPAVVLGAALAGLPVAAVDLTAQPRQIPPFDGVWQLNVGASTNPNGPPPPARRGGGGRRGGRGQSSALGLPGGVLLSIAPQGGPSAPDLGGRGGGTIESSLSGEEQVRFDAMRNFLLTAPPMMGLGATATDFTIVLDPTKKLGFVHKLDNKAVALNSPGGPGEFKAKWEGSKIRREIETRESLKVTEDYEVSKDTKQLIVTVKYDALMVRMPKVDVRRVYDRVATPAPAGQ
jgi:hypothetical protein